MNSIKNKITIILSIVSAIYSCSSGSHKQPVKNNDAKIIIHSAFDSTLSKGQVIQKTICGNDTAQTYALYLPSNYSFKKKWPVIFFFDPHASGALPLNKYTLLAEKYGYVMIGSNNSKNGLPIEATNKIAEILINDTQQRISIDKSRIYTGGFSGGSRVASSIAIYKGGIAGVIGCGAGFPKIDGPIEHSFYYLAFAGNEDFNLNEMNELDKALDKSTLRHDLVIFSGKHEWPPKETMEEAFIWLEINAMKDKIIAVNDTFINNKVNAYEDQAKHAEQKGEVYEAYTIYNHLTRYFEGLRAVSAYKKAIEAIEKTDKMQQIMKAKELLANKESGKQQEYMNAYSLKNMDWWKKEVIQLNKPIKNKKDETAMNKRLLGFLSLTSYMYSTSALKEEKFPEAEHFLELYRLIDPTNTEAFYLSACLSAKQMDAKNTLTYLKQSIKLGFTETERIKHEACFDFIRETKEYKQLIDTIEHR